MTDPRFLLAIPVYNEAPHLQRVLRQARPQTPHILVVDDGSTDRTPDILATPSGLHLMQHPSNRGYGHSLTDAFRFAIDGQFDWLITMDCDGQHQPAFLPKFMAAARSDRADLISGSRYLAAFAANTTPPPDRRWINARITALLNERLDLGITDAFCGFKAYRVARLPALSVTDPGYAMPLQTWVQIARARWRVAELPVPLIYHDPSRHFGGRLDDPATRYQHYLAVVEAELAGRTVRPETPRQDAVRAVGRPALNP